MKFIIKIFVILMMVFTMNYKLTLKAKNNVSINRVNATLQIIKTDVTNEEQTIEESIIVKNGDDVVLQDKQFYLCNRKPNDLKIIAITNDYVTISRQKLEYYVNDVHNEHTEEIIENINYNEPFSVSINQSHPLAGACNMARYSFELQFVKE